MVTRTIDALVLALFVAGSPLAGQPADGDVVVAVPGFRDGLILSYSASSGQFATLFSTPPVETWPEHVSMAEDNWNFITTFQDGYPPGGTLVMTLSPLGSLTTVAKVPGQMSMMAATPALDGDGIWILAGTHARSRWVWALANLATVTTLYHFYPRSTSLESVTDLIVDRDAGAGPYAILSGFTSTASPWLWWADRRGVLATLARGSKFGYGGMALESWSGDYLVAGPGGNVVRMAKGGGTTTLTTLVLAPASVALADDGGVWVGGVPPARYPWSPALYKLDGRGNVTTMVSLPQRLNFRFITDITIYGSRRLVCKGSGAPGTKVEVRLRSRRPGDRGKPYVLACSLARRPGLRMRGGAWLNLRPDPLFFLSGLGLAPRIFRNFQGVMDGRGEAVARVIIPPWLPRGLGVTVFVAGVVYHAGGIRTVTNTHWFVLN